MFLKRNGDLRVDKIPLETSPINKAFKTFDDQGADQCNVKRSKGRSRARFSFAQKLLSTKTKSQNIYTCFTFIEQFGATMTNHGISPTAGGGGLGRLRSSSPSQLGLDEGDLS